MSVFLNKLLHWQKYALFVSRLYLLPHSTLNFFLIGKGTFELLAVKGFFCFVFKYTKHVFCPEAELPCK